MIETIGDARRGARPTRADREARECPFAVGPVPNINAAGEVDRKYPVALSRASCSAKCALYDQENDRPCLDRVIEAVRGLAKLPMASSSA